MLKKEQHKRIQKISSGIKPKTFQLVAYYLTQLGAMCPLICKRKSKQGDVVVGFV
jgi:hypothetical protein